MNSVLSTRSSLAPRNGGGASSNRRSRTTTLLVAMSVSYGLLWLPFVIYTLLVHLNWSPSSLRTLKLVDELCKMLSMFSTCVNPFLYGFMNTNFAREFNLIFDRLVLCVRWCPFYVWCCCQISINYCIRF